MSALDDVCRQVTEESDEVLACAVYLLEPHRDDLEANQLRRLASHAVLPEALDASADFIRMAADTLGPEGQQRLEVLTGTACAVSADLYVTAQHDHYARFLAAKEVLVMVVLRATDSPALGWAALNSAALRIESWL